VRTLILASVGIALMLGAAWQVRTGLRDGTFFGAAGVRYQEDRNAEPLTFWGNLLLRASGVPVGAWFVWYAFQ
jgi:hypothetical protein